MELPLWLQENESSLPLIPQTRLRQKKSFLQKTLEEIIHFLQNSVFSERIAGHRGFLQTLDPRAKLIGLLLLLFTVNVIDSLALLWGSYLIIVIMAAVSGISPLFLLKRVWLVIPLFTGIMLFPALFNWVRPGDPLWRLWDFGHPIQLGSWELPSTLSITRQGLNGDTLIFSRVGISVSLAVILTMTTRWYSLLKALRFFFVPKIFVATLEMAYRYIFVLINMLEDILMARKARDAGHSRTSEQRRFVASSMASLFGKSVQLSEEVYLAMQARGYTGEVRTIQEFRFSLIDIFVLTFAILFCLILYAADKVLGG